MASEELAIAPPPTLAFGDPGRFDHNVRVAKMLADSQLVPMVFQKNIPNVIIAMEMAERMNASTMMIMQNMDIIHGKPSFSAKFNIACVNACGRFTPLEYVIVGEEPADSWGCYVTAKAKADGKERKGPAVTIATAKAEGWFGKSGSKWKTMPELMLKYRAATLWTRLYAPELVMGFPTSEEVIDIVGDTDSPPPPPAPRRATKGIGAMKQAEPVHVPDMEDPAPAPAPARVSESDASAQVSAASASTPAAAAEPEATPPPAKPPFKGRCEFVNYTEKEAKKAGGATGPVCTVQLKGDYDGIAYYDGPKTKLPAIGAVADVVLTESVLKNLPVKILTSFTILA